MIDILRELYNGEVYPAEQIDIEDESFQTVLRQHTEAKQEFRKGFQLGMQFTMAGLEKDRLEGLLKPE